MCLYALFVDDRWIVVLGIAFGKWSGWRGKKRGGIIHKRYVHSN